MRNRSARLTIALAMVLFCGSCGRPQPPPIRHVVLVIFDALRADRMSVYGHEPATTPFLESAQGEMVRYAHAKAPAPWTVPTHASIFTGLHPSAHGAQWGWMALEDHFLTLAEMLQGQGFLTVGYSANRFLGKQFGFSQGFEQHELLSGPQNERSTKILEMLPLLLDRVQTGDRRLFLFLNFLDTHIPFNVEAYGEDFGLDQKPPVRNAKQKWAVSAGKQPFNEHDKANHQKAYDAAVRQIDDVAKAIVRQLSERGLLDETLVVFTSDHGEGLGFHQQLGHSVSVWEEQLHVPLIVRFPGGWRGGDVVDKPTSLVALAPTLLDWLEVPRPDPLLEAPTLAEIAEEEISADYRSYLSELKRKLNLDLAAKYPDFAKTVSHTHVLYCDEFKLIVNAHSEVLFFDLAEDPEEQVDLAGESPEELSACMSRYRQLLGAGRFVPFEKRHSDAELELASERVDLEILRSLGYVE